MSGRRRDRIQAVLRVRRIQQDQAALEVTRAVDGVRRAEQVLAARRARYDVDRGLDRASGAATDVMAAHARRVIQAGSVIEGRGAVRAAHITVEERRAELVARAQATKGLEKLDGRLVEEADDERRTRDERTVDDMQVARHGRRPR